MLGCLIVYIANVSLIFINTLKVPAHLFAYYQTSAMVAFCAASFIAARYAAFFGISRGEWIGGTVFFAGGAMLVGVGAMYPGSPILISASMVLISCGIAIAALGFFAESLQTVGNKAGAAVSLAQSLRMLILAGMTELSRHTFDGTIMGVIKVVGPSVLLCLLILVLREKFRPAAATVVDVVHGVA